MERRLCRLTLAAAVVTTLGAALVGPRAAGQAAAATSCGVRWGSLEKQAGRNATAPLSGAAAGRHACYDRLVFTLSGIPGGYRVGYATQILTQGRGLPVGLRGGASLQVTILDPASTTAGVPTYSPPVPAEAVGVGGFSTFRQVAYAGTFEGYTSFGVGVRARLPFRVFVLPGPGSNGRLVVDVAHGW
jgi:hypothetical protein